MEPYTGVQPLLLKQPIIIQMYETDYAGVISNVEYIRWLEVLRRALMDTYSSTRELIQQDVALAVHTLNITYRRPVFTLDELEGRVWIEKMGRTSIFFRYELLVDGMVRTTAAQRCVFLNIKTGKQCRVPDGIRIPFQAVETDSE